MIKKLLLLIEDMFVKHLEILTVTLEEAKDRQYMNQYYIETGKAIQDIINLYPVDGEDAVIIFEEWSKGVLTYARPSAERLRDFARFTASDECWRNYIKANKNSIS